MSTLSDLIRKHAPSGVQCKTLDELGVLYGGLTGKSKADFAEGAARFVSYVNVFNNLSTNVTPEDRVTVRDGERQNRVRYGDVLFTGSSESANEVGMASGVTSEPPEPLYLNSFCFGFRPHNVDEIDPEFAKHLFRSRVVRKQIIRTANGVTRINVSKVRFRDVRIPVPTLGIQREIASILDKMAGLGAELQAQLEAELDLRSRQYAFCRDELLTFRGEEVRWATMGEVVAYTNGKAHERLVDAAGDVPLITARFISRNGEANRYVLAADVLTPAAAGDIALVLSDLPRGRALARTFFVDRDGSYAINQRIARLRVRDPFELMPRFLFHVLDRNPGLLVHDNGIDQTHLSKGQIVDLKIPVPPMAEQERLVAVLDLFDALRNDSLIALTAEIEARRTQYEHYRDRLLTFDEGLG